MITRIREVRRARGMTLDDVAKACSPPTTPQTVGQLETGTRTVSVGWLNRIAPALGVDAATLVTLPDRVDVPVSAVFGPDGPTAPKRVATLLAPAPAGEAVVRPTAATPPRASSTASAARAGVCTPRGIRRLLRIASAGPSGPEGPDPSVARPAP